MARFAPLITLGTVAALGGGLLLVNTTIDSPAAPTAGTASAVAPAAPDAVQPGGVPPGDAPLAAAPPVAAPPAAAPPADAPPAGAPPAPAVAEAAYTGRTAGNEVTVAVAVKDGRAVAYLCDGKKVEAWFEGTVTGADLELSGSDGKTTLTATASDKAVLGTVTVGGKERPFAAASVAAPAGLYEGNAAVRGVLTRIGWIVDGQGNVTGVANAGGKRQPAPELDPTDPTAATMNGVPLTVAPLDGGDRVIRR